MECVYAAHLQDDFYDQCAFYPLFRTEKCSWNRVASMDDRIVYNISGMFCQAGGEIFRAAKLFNAVLKPRFPGNESAR